MSTDLPTHVFTGIHVYSLTFTQLRIHLRTYLPYCQLLLTYPFAYLLTRPTIVPHLFVDWIPYLVTRVFGCLPPSGCLRTCSANGLVYFHLSCNYLTPRPQVSHVQRRNLGAGMAASVWHGLCDWWADTTDRVILSSPFMNLVCS